MLFNSFEFIIFLAIVFALYWFVFNKNLNVQNALLLVAGYVFYGWWDYRFLFLLMLSSTVDYVVGITMNRTSSAVKRKLILTLSITFNITLLGFFKYFNFFVDSFAIMLDQIGFQVNPRSLNVILPVGISFYTFQSLSYTIDVFKNKMQPTRNPLTFFTFVSFFPQLVAGPIERALKMIPQFSVNRKFDPAMATDGLRQMLWGFFKKVVIADNCAVVVNNVFANYQTMSGSDLLLGAVYFAFQIYGDFSGYSDIAIGTAKLFGFNLMQNFAVPYFSRDIPEFWRRWHISLSTWFRDYLYIPLGGNKGKKISRIKNILITFTVSGFWHGANWTYVFWGFLNGLYYIPLMLFNKHKKQSGVVAEKKMMPGFKEMVQMAVTFALVVFAWIIFRSETITDAFRYVQGIFSMTIFSIPQIDKRFLFFILLLVLIEWIQREKQHALQFSIKPVALRWALYIAIIIVIFSKSGAQQEFIYFQF